MFTLLDSLTLPGHPGKPNDDALGFSETAALVMDGATALSEPLMPGKSDPAWLATFGARRVLAHLREGKPARGGVRAAMLDAERSFAALRRRAPLETYEVPFASMMLVVEQGGAIEALSFGDCTAIVQRPDRPAETVGRGFESRAAEARGVAQLAKARGLSPTAGLDRAEFLEHLRNARNRVNGKTGPWLFGPDARAAGHMAVKRIETPAQAVLLLATDGFLALASDYGRYDAAGLVTAAVSIGLAALGRELRGIEDADASGAKYPRFKTSDDATAILLRVS